MGTEQLHGSPAAERFERIAKDRLGKNVKVIKNCHCSCVGLSDSFELIRFEYRWVQFGMSHSISILKVGSDYPADRDDSAKAAMLL
ncbi:hypothetical protein WT98_17725 [Burkholderia territorii]|nr:hypothetical protein WT98_17725 [Burkholderia territorii]